MASIGAIEQDMARKAGSAGIASRAICECYSLCAELNLQAVAI